MTIHPFLKKYFKYLLLALLMYMPIFGFLSTLPIRIWDEARCAINAYEMMNNDHFIVTYFEGLPDMWNTKPPLLIWVQVVFMKIFGVNEVAVRLPSALAAFFTCISLLILSIRYLKQFWFGFIAIVILITSDGYISLHGTRTGDYDALLTLFTTLSALSLFVYFETNKTKHLYLFFLCTAMAVMTKGISGLLLMPALALYTIWQKQLLPLLRTKHFYIGLASFLLFTIGYYYLRELKNPGYINAVFENEFGGRYLTALDDHKQGTWFYLTNIMERKFSYWYLLVPCGFVIGFIHKNSFIKKLSVLSGLSILTYFIIVTLVKTKLEWYDMPMYPFLAILVAIFIYHIFEFLKNYKRNDSPLRFNFSHFIFLFLIISIPYQKILNKTYHPKEEEKFVDFYEVGYFLKDAVKGRQDINGYYLLYDGYNAHNDFYLKVLQDKNTDTGFKDWWDLKKDDLVFTHQPELKEYIDNHYDFEITREVENIIFYKIKNRKPNN